MGLKNDFKELPIDFSLYWDKGYCIWHLKSIYKVVTTDVLIPQQSVTIANPTNEMPRS